MSNDTNDTSSNVTLPDAGSNDTGSNDTMSYEQEEDEEAVEEAVEEGRAQEEKDRDDPEWDEKPPERWPEDLKEAYNGLPIEAKKAMLDKVYKPMQRAYGESTQQLAQMKRQLEPMLKAMNDYRPDFERNGVDPQQAFQAQMAWAAHFNRVGPEQGLKDMRDAYGFSENQQTGQEAQEYLTPVERSLKSQVEQLTQMVQGTSEAQRRQAEQAHNQRLAAQYHQVRNELVSFSNEEVNGKPAHPHMEKVAPAIAGLIRGGMVKRADEYGQPVPFRNQIAQAYEMAVNLDPSLRTAQSGGQAAKARAAQRTSVVAKNPVNAVDVEDLSLDESIEKSFNTLARRRSA